MEDTCPSCGSPLLEVSDMIGVTCWKCPKCNLLVVEHWMEPGTLAEVVKPALDGA